ncbi:PspC domain-containing protein [Sphingobacteriales bacterium UPWRP_1]|nr:hypothetical protein B6N25_09075 [Sphingobacteriales bacterium TSM_CSS]PSJ77651.1 PspC domain-containing protein [Sphingobacteriales bacterium UPWRP_1]
MNKTISINLGGWFFHIEEDAYNRLHNYLESIGNHFSGEEGAKEIVEDIEARIAEMFQEALSKHKRQVVLPGDVETVIGIMGHPEEFDDSGSHESASGKGGTNNTGDNFTQQQPPKPDSGTGAAEERYRRLYRNPDDKVLGGVCSGISAYFGIKDPIWVRLAFVAALLILGWGVMLYILLWMIVPEASTSGQKLAMKGEPINISNIEKTFKEGFEGLKSQIEDFSKSESGKNTRFFFEQLTDKARKIIPNLLLIAVKIAKVAVIIFGLILLFSLVVTLLGLVVGLFASFRFLLTFIFSKALPVVFSIISVVLLFGIPILLISYFFTRKIFKINNGGSGKWKQGAIVVWAVSLFLLLSLVGKTYQNDFSQTARLQEQVNITQPTGNTLYISALDNNYLKEVRKNNRGNVQMLLPVGNWGRTVFDYQNNAMFFEDVKLNVEESQTDKFELVKSVSALSGNLNNAQNLAQHIEYVMEQEDSVLLFNPYFSAPAADKWRNQQIELTLKVPKGKSVFFLPGAEKVIYDVKNTTNTLDAEMIGLRWTMLPEGLTMDSPPQKLTDETEVANSGAPVAPIAPIAPVAPPALNGEKQQNFDFADFERIEITGFFKVHIQQAPEYKVTVAGSAQDMEKVRAELDGDKLNISMGGKGWLDGWHWLSNEQAELVQVYITMPNLTQLEFNGACEGNVQGFNAENDLDLTVSGASKMNAFVKVSRIEAEITGASELTLNGSAGSALYKVTGASGLKAYSMEVTQAEVETTGASHAELTVNGEMDADATGASSISYKGAAQNVRSETSGAAAVKNAN